MNDLLKGAPNWVCKVDTGGQHSKWRKTFESCGKVMWLRSCYRATWIVCFWKLRKVSGYEMFRMFLKEIQKSFDKVCYKTGNQKHPNFLCDEKVEIKSSFLFKTTQRSAQRPHFDQSFMPRKISKNARTTALHCGKLDQNFQSLSMILILCHIIECEKWFLNACLEDGSTWIMKKLLVRKYTNSCSDWPLRFVENPWFVLEIYLKICLQYGNIIMCGSRDCQLDHVTVKFEALWKYLISVFSAFKKKRFDW